MNRSSMNRRKKVKFNNKHKVPNDIADEIRGLSNEQLIARVNQEYNNWQAIEIQKKEDTEINRVKELVRGEKDAMKEDPEYVKLEEEFQKRKDELVTEELARYEEELKNLSQDYNEDAKAFRNQFRLSMDEMTARKEDGLLKLPDLT